MHASARSNATGRDLLLERLPAAETEAARLILDECPLFEVEPGEPHLAAAFGDAGHLIVDNGFVVLRSTRERTSRSIVTHEAGPGEVLLAPADDEVLQGLVRSWLVVVDPDALNRLNAIGGAAAVLVEGLGAALAQAQESIGNFAHTRHLERTRAKLRQLGRRYGSVGRDGIRFELPVSHLILAEMIGSSRETVTRALDELERTGFLERRGRGYHLLPTPAD